MQKPVKSLGCPLGAKCQEEDENEIRRCPWYQCVRGQNPNTGEEIDEWACSISFLPMLLIENSQQSRQTGAAVESFRNGVISGNEQLAGILGQISGIAQTRRIEKEVQGDKG